MEEKLTLKKFEEIKTQYRNLLDVNPCLIIQISNKQKADEELNNEILPALNGHPDLKWMLIVNNPKECDTNDVFKAKKLPVSLWKNYARGNLSNIDVIIFKLVISEGWDIPRACMLYQARNSRSKQLDEQVMGRVRRNPRLLDYETLSDEGKKLATMAWVWGVVDNDTRKAYAVKLYDDQKDITDEVKIKTTVIKPLSEDTSFNINQFLDDRTPKITHKSIFELNRKLQVADYSVKTMIYDYADGYSRLLSGKADVLVKGKRCPIIGRICMDQLVLDVSGAGDVKEGEIVTLIGKDGNEEITADELASLYGTIGYEVVCGISKRVPRIYVD